MMRQEENIIYILYGFTKESLSGDEMLLMDSGD